MDKIKTMKKQHQYINNPIVYKALSGLAIKADETSRTVSGYLAAFGVKDLQDDILIRGCFAKSLSEHGVNSTSPQKIAYLYQHEIEKPIGRFTRLEEDEKGLYFEAEIDKIPLGDQVLTQYQSGTLNQHSIGFRYIWDKIEYDEMEKAYIVKEVKLFEGSVVTIGANENTPFTGMKSADLTSHANQLIRETEAFLKSMGEENAYKLRQLISKHIALSQVEPEHTQPQKPQKIDYKKLTQSIINL